MQFNPFVSINSIISRDQLPIRNRRTAREKDNQLKSTEKFSDWMMGLERDAASESEVAHSRNVRRAKTP
jgi:hypothetical protein